MHQLVRLRSLGFGFVSVSMVCAGCSFGYANVVRRDAQGGILALQGMRGPAMDDAQQQMAAHCGGPNRFAIVAEENVVVGQQTSSASDTNYGERYGRRGTRGSQSTSSTTTTTDVSEYRVTYQCVAPGATTPVMMTPTAANTGTSSSPPTSPPATMTPSP